MYTALRLGFAHLKARFVAASRRTFGYHRPSARTGHRVLFRQFAIVADDPEALCILLQQACG